MTKCYGHEECEFNAQPNCALPNGMECPHRVKADKPAVKSWLDIEAQIEKLNQYSQSLIAYQMGVEFADVCMDVAAALSTLQAENEKLRAELERVKVERDAYQAYFKDLSSKPDCNTCEKRNCDYRPKPGATVRANCPLYSGPQKED